MVYTCNRMVKANNSNALSVLLSSRVMAEVFRLLFGLLPARIHIREIQRQSGLAVGTVRQELLRLANLGIVHATIDGNRTYYEAAQNHPLYPEIRSMVLKTVGLVDVIRESLRGADVQVAFVFGSLAQGAERADSDIDLMVIGNLTLRQLSQKLAGVGDKLGREINPHVLTPSDFVRRRNEADHFIANVLAFPKLFVIGEERELEAIG